MLAVLLAPGNRLVRALTAAPLIAASAAFCRLTPDLKAGCSCHLDSFL